MGPARRAPAFAPRTFTQWFAAQPPLRGASRRAALWPDTFTNHFEPGVAIAAARVLREAGVEVVVPSRPLCYGRPLYDYGMLMLACRQLRQLLRALAPEIRLGTPVIALEPSCGGVFRDELTRLTCTLGEHLERQDPGCAPAPVLHRRALLHHHCHHSSRWRSTAARADGPAADPRARCPSPRRRQTEDARPRSGRCSLPARSPRDCSPAARARRDA